MALTEDHDKLRDTDKTARPSQDDPLADPDPVFSWLEELNFDPELKRELAEVLSGKKDQEEPVHAMPEEAPAQPETPQIPLESAVKQPPRTGQTTASPFLQWLGTLPQPHTKAGEVTSQVSAPRADDRVSPDAATVTPLAERETASPITPGDAIAESPEKSRKEKKEKKDKKKKKKKRPTETVSEEETLSDLDSDIASETLARLLINMGHIDDAVKMYERLRLKYPEKSRFFAAKIDELKKTE